MRHPCSHRLTCVGCYPAVRVIQVEGDASERVWIVEFYTTWASDCAQFSSLFAELSIK